MGLSGCKGLKFFLLLRWLEFDLLLQQLKQEKKPERDWVFVCRELRIPDGGGVACSAFSYSIFFS